MAISEKKMQMVIANYFKDECDVNTSIRQAFEKGFRIGLKKGISADKPQGEWIIHSNGKMCDCSACNESYDRTFEYVDEWNFCPNCGAKMKGADDE